MTIKELIELLQKHEDRYSVYLKIYSSDHTIIRASIDDIEEDEGKFFITGTE